MALSGTYNFGINTELDEVIVEGYSRIGIQASELSNEDIQSAIRSLNYMFADWANKGVNLWEVALNNTTLTQGQTSFALSAKNVTILQAYRRSTVAGVSTDILLTPISRADYAAIPLKSQQGPPTQFYLERTITPTVYFWPVPDTTYAFYYYVMNFTQDPGNMTNTLDVPQRWFDAMAAGLAVRLATKKNPTMKADLKMDAETAYAAAAAEDTESVPTRIVPSLVGRSYYL